MKTTLYFLWSTVLVVSLFGQAGCLGPLDTVGVVAENSRHEDLFRDPEVEDDRIEDKHPACQSDLTVQEEFDGCTFTVGKSCSVTKLDVIPFDKGDEDLATRLYPTRSEALADLGQRGGDVLPSMEVVNGVLKPFNDGLYAAVEYGVEDGIPGIFPSKRQFLRDLATATASAIPTASGGARGLLEDGLVVVLGGLLAGGQDVSGLGVDPAILTRAQQEVERWDEQGVLSRPIGFYTWSAPLAEIFRQDRFLQNQLDYYEPHLPVSPGDFGRFAALAAVMQDATPLATAYQQILSVYQGLTNPYNSYSAADLSPYVDGLAGLDDLSGARDDFLAENDSPFVCRGAWLALLPASRSRDSDFFSETFCETPPPADANLINALINAIRDGLVDLEPSADSGWYDYQLYALSTLLVPESLPESDHLLLTAAYKKKLIETFKSLITQTRETHVKQLSVPMLAGSAAPIHEVDVYPKFPVEPFPSFYLRTARAYRFLETYLKAVLGPGFLAASHRRYADDSESPLPLDEELHDITRLVYGLYIQSARSVGLDPADGLLPEETEEYPVDASAQRAEEWLSSWTTDPDVLTDPRVILPVAMTEDGQVIYWAVLGVQAVRISAAFVEHHVPTFETEDFCELRDVVDHQYLLLTEAMREVRLPRTTPPPTREEFRALCDAHDNVDDIVTALEGL